MIAGAVSAGAIHLHGQDANGGLTRSCRWYGTGHDIRTQTGGNAGNGEIGFWDRGEAGNTHVGNYAQFSNAHAPGFVTDSAGDQTAQPGMLSRATGNVGSWFGSKSECWPSHIMTVT